MAPVDVLSCYREKVLRACAEAVMSSSDSSLADILWPLEVT